MQNGANSASLDTRGKWDRRSQAVLGVLMLVAFAPTLWETIANEWWVRPEWSHGATCWSST